MSMEGLKHFKKIDNISEYVREGIKSGKLTIDEVAKFAKVQARQGQVGEKIVTLFRESNQFFKETVNTVKIDKTTGQPGWVVTNPDGEKYIVEDSDFREKYEIDPKNPSEYRSKGKPVLSIQIDEHIEFEAPWGGTMKIECGGSLMLSGPNDIYGIQKTAFEHTYASTGKDKTESLKEALALMGISKEEFMAAKQKEEHRTVSGDDKVVNNDEQEFE